MADEIQGTFTVLGCRQVGEIKPPKPGTNYGAKKSLKLKLENEQGQVGEEEFEWYTGADAKEPAVGEKIQGIVWKDPSYGWKFKKPGRAGGGGGGGGGRSPKDTAAIQRQHSQEMALRHEATLVAAGNPPWNLEQVREMTDWFEKDINGKAPPVTWDPMQSDVPADLSDTPLFENDEPSVHNR